MCRVATLTSRSSITNRPVDDRDAVPQRGRLGPQQRLLLLALGLWDPPLHHASAIDDAAEPRRKHADQRGDAGDQKHRRYGQLNHAGDGFDRAHEASSGACVSPSVYRRARFGV
jgi:hypothetical protein